jgi:uncharacterized protein
MEAPDAESRQRRLVAALRDPRRYPHPASRVEPLETHISHVLLAGDFAYKIKKPVSLGFLDFGDLDSRRHYCEVELRLNRRTAPVLYLEVIPIGGSEDEPVLNGEAPAIEYALKMRRFPQDALLSKLLERGELTNEHVDALAAKIAKFHSEIESAQDADSFGEARSIEQPARQNFEQLPALLGSGAEELEALRRYTERAHSQLAEIFRRRKREGFVRECHGDLHLDNIALFEGETTLFDCVEFNDELRWIDVMSEIAFVVMDLCAHERNDFAFLLLNAYLERTGDYGGLSVLPYYLVYRALVRAKVIALRAKTHEESDRVRAYLSLARRLAEPGRPAIIISHGLSGSGKSTLAQRLLQDFKAIRVRSDVERQRLFAGAPGDKLYSARAIEDTYVELERLARVVTDAGYPVIVDATFLKRAQRERFQKLATALGIPFAILESHAPQSELGARVVKRAEFGRDPSDADLAVLEHQLATREALTPEEQQNTIRYDSSSGDSAYDSCRSLLKSRLALA